MNNMHGTTILCVKKGKQLVIASDGQVTMGDMVCKDTAKKVRSIFNNNTIAGFAGSVADSLAFISRLESKLEQYSGDLVRSVIELSKDWRSDKYLRNLETSLLVADKDCIMSLGGNGEALEVDSNIASVGSGSKFALAAAYALIDTDIEAYDIVKKSMGIASKLCVYTNNNLSFETVDL
ncbi:MAG: ATP-dependent protease subunit HslV [Alphaproteobacteria bacterium]|nr:ATP-dependent protease subunit HslV [Rickettsiales bacterium]